MNEPINVHEIHLAPIQLHFDSMKSEKSKWEKSVNFIKGNKQRKFHFHTLATVSSADESPAGTSFDCADDTFVDGTISSWGNITILYLSSLHFIKILQIAWMSNDLHCSDVNYSKETYGNYWFECWSLDLHQFYAEIWKFCVLTSLKLSSFVSDTRAFIKNAWTGAESIELWNLIVR